MNAFHGLKAVASLKPDGREGRKCRVGAFHGLKAVASLKQIGTGSG